MGTGRDPGTIWNQKELEEPLSGAFGGNIDFFPLLVSRMREHTFA